jgi:hypothetical protein
LDRLLLFESFFGDTSFELGRQVSSFSFTHWSYFGGVVPSKISAKSRLFWLRFPGPLHKKLGPSEVAEGAVFVMR